MYRSFGGAARVLPPTRNNAQCRGVARAARGRGLRQGSPYTPPTRRHDTVAVAATGQFSPFSRCGGAFSCSCVVRQLSPGTAEAQVSRAGDQGRHYCAARTGPPPRWRHERWATAAVALRQHRDMSAAVLADRSDPFTANHSAGSVAVCVGVGTCRSNPSPQAVVPVCMGVFTRSGATAASPGRTLQWAVPACRDGDAGGAWVALARTSG